MEDKADEFRVFLYTEEEQDRFPYIREYMVRLKPRMREVFADERMRGRLMLVGLFRTYRACNHVGIPFDTADFGDWPEGIHKERMAAYVRTGGPPFSSATDYLHMLGLGIVKLFLGRLGNRLYRFVLRGR